MTQQERDAIKAREKAATPGPWELENQGSSVETANIQCQDQNGNNLFDTFNAHGQEIHSEHDEDGSSYFENGQRRKDIEFAAHARADVPALLEENERLRTALEPFADMWDVMHAEGLKWGDISEGVLRRAKEAYDG